MRKSITAIVASLALGIASSAMAETITHYTSSNGASLEHGSSVQAGSFSGATTLGTGFAGTYGISNQSAKSSGRIESNGGLGLVKGTSSVQGHSESGTLVEGLGAAGSIAGGTAEAGGSGEAGFEAGSHKHDCFFIFCGPSYDHQTDQYGEAGVEFGSTGSSWAATGSIGSGEGLSVQGFEASGNASAKSIVKERNNGSYKANTRVRTSSGALTYTIESGKAIGETEAAGWGMAGADAWRVHED